MNARMKGNKTLVMVSSEFVRTPNLNANAGRDHWPKVFLTLPRPR